VIQAQIKHRYLLRQVLFGLPTNLLLGVMSQPARIGWAIESSSLELAL
jgi:hypothetical protein